MNSSRDKMLFKLGVLAVESSFLKTTRVDGG